jgi:2-keto-4-pentenoate hydratase/2-oxohepta-3-ene-1,7-dioic acid hydratase in catechol pathway
MAAGAWYSKTRSVYCIGRNYLAHANELNNAVGSDQSSESRFDFLYFDGEPDNAFLIL